MKASLLLIALCAFNGCDDPPPIVHYTIRGTVRNVWCATPNECNVVFEHDQGGLQSVTFVGVPPVWTGMRCQITFHRVMNILESGEKIDSVERIR